MPPEPLDPSERNRADEMVSRLDEALERENVDLLRSALRNGVSVNARNPDGLTPLMRAAQNGWVSGARILLDAGADPDAIDGQGQTAADLDPYWPAERGMSESGGEVAALIMSRRRTE